MKRKLSIIVPVYNERNFVGRAITEIVEAVTGDVRKEIIVVDDGSTDHTFLKIKKSKKQNIKSGVTIKVVRLKKNKGKGAAIRAGLKKVTGDMVLIQDADLEYDPKEIVNLLQPILDEYADVVYGSRFMGDRPHRVLFFWHMVANKFLTLISNMLTNLNLTDMETGYKVFKTEIIKKIRIKENRFGFEPEITAKIARMSCRVYEVGISYKGRKYDQGKKINWRDGVWALYCILKYNLF